MNGSLIIQTGNPALDVALLRVLTAYEHTVLKHPAPPASRHESYAIIKEELDEAWADIKANDFRAAHEVEQVAACCVRYLLAFAPQCQPRPPINPGTPSLIPLPI